MDMARFLELAVRARRNIVVSGGTGTGKTTLLNCLSELIAPEERIVTIEDSAELQLHHDNLVTLEARPRNSEGRGLVSIRDLVRNALRMRPDRIVVGECRGGEALDMLQAMNTGHDGSLTTAHANSPRDLLSRLEVMSLMAGMELPLGGSAGADCKRREYRRAAGTLRLWLATDRVHFRSDRHGKRQDPDAGPVSVRAHGYESQRTGTRAIPVLRQSSGLS